MVRQDAYYAMQLLADKFVLGSTIEKAFKRAQKDVKQGYCHSFDMLGEAALTNADAERYYQEYLHAIQFKHFNTSWPW